jgi:hypothetical protein
MSEELATREYNKYKTLDEYVTDACLFKTTGEILDNAENKLGYGSSLKSQWIARLIKDALLDMDITTIQTIVNRIDGLVPDKHNRSEYANYMGSALDDVMGMSDERMLAIMPDEPAIISLAKVVVYISMSKPGNNIQMRKAKNQAIDMILTRCGGRVPEPVKEAFEVRFEDPDWMRLPEATEQEFDEDCCNPECSDDPQ